MRRHTTTALSLSALAVLALAGCSTGPAPSATAQAHRDAKDAAPAPLSSATLAKRLLDKSDLGERYTRRLENRETHDDITVVGCPALEQLDSEAATGSSFAFPRKAKASFTYAGDSDSLVSEELYSDTAARLSKGVSEIFHAMVSCPTYQVVSGSTVVDMSTHQTTAPDLGDEQWSQLLTYSARGQRSVVKQTAIRTGDVLIALSGPPELVDANLAKALAKAQAAR